MTTPSAETDQPCPPTLRCPDRSLCPVACMEAGSREDPTHRPARHPADRSLPSSNTRRGQFAVGHHLEPTMPVRVYRPAGGEG